MNRTESMPKTYVSGASGQCARALFSMTNLRSVKLQNIEINDEFFSVMAELASGSQVNNNVLITWDGL